MVRAQHSYKGLRARYESIASEALVSVTFTLSESAATAFQVAQRCNGEALRARFERLAASGEWSIASLDAMTDASLAAYYVDAQAREAEAVASTAKVPAKLASDAKEVRDRMDYVLTFLFGKDEKMIPVLDALRAGRGHQATATALLRYSQLYGEHHDLVSVTPVHYRATDKDASARLGGEILGELHSLDGGEMERWTQLRRRAATYLLSVYEDVAEAGRFIERNDPEVDAHYPSLVAAGRTYKTTVKAAKPSPPDPSRNDPAKPA